MGGGGGVGGGGVRKQVVCVCVCVCVYVCVYAFVRLCDCVRARVHTREFVTISRFHLAAALNEPADRNLVTL